MDLKKPIEPKDGCVASAMEIVGNKWTALIIRDLFVGPKRFCQLEESVGGVNPRTLSKRLLVLEQHGIIKKATFNEVPPRSEYSLTKKGEDLLPIIQGMSNWGAKYDRQAVTT
ncbi:MAG: helix-turn-helix domain-containing protein [Candidatus Saccharibacteria bacterium]